MLNSAKELTDERPLGLDLSDHRVYHQDPACQEVYHLKVDIFGSKPCFSTSKVDIFVSHLLIASP